MPSSEQQVRERAYFIWEGEGRVFGRAVDHWLKAEAEFRAMDEAPAASAKSAAKSPAKSPTKTLKPRAARTGSAAAVAVEAKAKATKPPAAKVAAQKPKPKAASRSHAPAGAVLH